ncbi:MAG: metal-dependent transcriptional regulator [Candidatus Hadarchaeales archaeon]
MRTAGADEYLEVLWDILAARSPAGVKEIADRLGISQPSVVQMLDKMKNRGLVRYEKRTGVNFTAKGARRARAIVRNHRLMEVLLVRVVGLQSEGAERAVCGAEHHLSEKAADSICTFLNHPRHCPHGNEIPRGKCCP